MNMCGIAGLFDRAGMAHDPQRMRQALERLKLRGPDDAGVWYDEYVHFGHRRLAVLDLSPAGAQPRESADGRHVIVFNGEIYNHLELRSQMPAPAGGWRGHSDTETLLEAYIEWGPDCLQRLNGMFAFAIWERDSRRLFAARDRLGVKPLYYAQRGTRLAFASRPGALRALDPSSVGGIDEQALRAYLELGYIPAPLALHQGVRKLSPAHYLVADDRGVRLTRYWDFRHITPDAGIDARAEEEVLDEFDEVLRRAVRQRLLADVPVGAFLSGGIDSALIVACMQRETHRTPRTFTIGFREAEYDESAAASAIARHFGVEQTTEVLDAPALFDLLPTFIEEYDEPIADSSAFATLAVSRLARRQVTVALSGDGGDEAFGGYHYYPMAQRLQSVMRWPAPLRNTFTRLLARLPSHRGKLLAGALRDHGVVSMFHYLRTASKDFGAPLQPDALQRTSGSLAQFAQFAASFAMDLGAAEVGMRLDTGLLLPNLYLQKVDVASMAYSLEARCPFTDYRLVEWAMRLPLRYKLRGAETKYLPKKLLSRYLPAAQVYRPKQGFGLPIAAWLRGPFRGWVNDLLHDDQLFSLVPLDRQRLQEIMRQHVSGERDAHPVLWASLMLLCYLRRHELGGEGSAVNIRPARVAA
jgi:asparagine synthase (glutamine-hydrolysing)